MAFALRPGSSLQIGHVGLCKQQPPVRTTLGYLLSEVYTVCRTKYLNNGAWAHTVPQYRPQRTECVLY